jgi:hypothetical protein
MTDPELVEQIARAIGAELYKPDSVVPGAYTYVPWEWQKDRCYGLARAILPLIASREAAAADKRQAEIVAWLRQRQFAAGSFSDAADAIESGSFRA